MTLSQKCGSIITVDSGSGEQDHELQSTVGEGKESTSCM